MPRHSARLHWPVPWRLLLVHLKVRGPSHSLFRQSSTEALTGRKWRLRCGLAAVGGSVLCDHNCSAKKDKSVLCCAKIETSHTDFGNPLRGNLKRRSHFQMHRI